LAAFSRKLSSISADIIISLDSKYHWTVMSQWTNCRCRLLGCMLFFCRLWLVVAAVGYESCHKISHEIRHKTHYAIDTR